MSNLEDNPFHTNNDYAPQTQGPPKSSSTKKLLIGCGIFGLLGMVVCCGGVAYVAYQLPQLVNTAMAGQLREQLATEPNVQERIGEIQSIEFDFSGTVESAQKAEESGGEPSLAFRIQGSNGQGVVVIVQDPRSTDGFGIKSGTLVMDDGTEYPLDVSAISASPVDSLDIDMEGFIDEGEAFTPGEGPTEE